MDQKNGLLNQDYPIWVSIQNNVYNYVSCIIELKKKDLLFSYLLIQLSSLLSSLLDLAQFFESLLLLLLLRQPNHLLLLRIHRLIFVPRLTPLGGRSLLSLRTLLIGSLGLLFGVGKLTLFLNKLRTLLGLRLTLKVLGILILLGKLILFRVYGLPRGARLLGSNFRTRFPSWPWLADKSLVLLVDLHVLLHLLL